MDPKWVDLFPSLQNGDIPVIAMWSFTKGYIDLPVPGYFAPKALKAVIVAWTVTDGFPDGPGADPSKWNYVQTLQMAL